jgi:hypothetical protein
VCFHFLLTSCQILCYLFFQDGLLTLTAPKKKLEPERVVRIRITEGPSDEDDADVKTDVQAQA